MNWLEFLIMGLATWRIASMVANEDGPYEMFARFRKWTGEYYVTEIQRSATTPWGKGLVCLWCVSTWTGFFFLTLFLLMTLIGPIHLYLALPFALSAMAILINTVVDH